MKLFDRLAQDNRNVAVRLLDSIKDFISKVKSTFSGDKAKADTAAKEKYGARVEELERATYLWEKMLSDTGTAVASGNINTAGTDADGGRMYDLKGKRADGIEVYETSKEVKAMPWKDRKKRFLNLMKEEFFGRTAKFTNKGQTYYARFDSEDVNKNIYGDDYSDDAGKDAKINTGADGFIFELVENSQYDGFAKEKGKPGKAHKEVSLWDYFIKKVQIDGKVYDLIANVRKKESGEFVYSIQMNEDKSTEAAPPENHTKKGGVNGAQTASTNIIPDSLKKSNRQNSLKTEDLLSPDYGKGETSAEHQDDRGNSSSVAKIPPPSSDGPPPFRAREAKDADGSYIEDTGGTARDDGETVQNDGNVIQYTHEEADGIRKDSQTFRNVIEGIDITLSEFFSKWKSGRKNGEKLEKLYLGKASESVKKKISDLLGYEIPNRDFIITNDAVKHVHDEHGDIQKEEGLGQIVVNEETISTIVETLNNPDSVTKEFRKKEPRIVFKKKTNAGDVIAVEVDNKGRATLSLKTVYIKKGQESTQRGDFPEDTRANLLTSETTVPNSSDNVTIPQESGNVKGNGTHTMYREYENHQVISILKYHLVILLSSI